MASSLSQASLPGRDEATPVAKRKVLKMADARRMTREYLEQKDKQQDGFESTHQGSRQSAAPNRTVTDTQKSEHKRDIHPREKQQDHRDRGAARAYTADIDVNFFGTSFEEYVVSRKAKRKGGGREFGAASAWCGEMVLPVKYCNWLQKICFFGVGSSRRLGSDCLLYLASRDGFFNNVFHKKVDLKGPTLTLVMTSDGRVFGGYASVPWAAGTTGKLVADPLAFLVSLSDGKGRPPIKIPQADSSPEDAVFHDPDLGPCFNRPLGLQLDILAYSSSDFCKNAKYRIPPGYDDRTFLAGAYNGWDIQEVAVWAV